jgi:hypothetical protein
MQEAADFKTPVASLRIFSTRETLDQLRTDGQNVARASTPLGTVQALFGHSSSEVTREVYLHSIPSGARGAVQKVEYLLIGPRWTQVVQIPKMRSFLIQ